MSRPLAWAVAVALTAAPAALAQAPKIETKAVSFSSADGVELQGTIYKSAKGPGSPCVILLHSLFADPNKGDWDGLAVTLAEKYTVLRFDFRGHGKSFVIDAKKFWANPVNVRYMPALANKNPLPVRLDFKDFESKKPYAAQLANDILAARVFLDQENDGGTANTSSVYLVGATDAATVGMLYIAAEWKRPSVIPQARAISTIPATPRELDRIQSEPAGGDIAGAVWLSATLHPSMTATAMRNLVSGPYGSPDMREKNPMWFLYGDGDKAPATGLGMQKFFYNDVLVAKPAAAGVKLQPVKFTEMVPIKESKALVGVNLLGNQLGTEAKILEFLEKIEKDRKSPARIPNRNYTKAPLIRADLFGAFAK